MQGTIIIALGVCGIATIAITWITLGRDVRHLETELKRARATIRKQSGTIIELREELVEARAADTAGPRAQPPGVRRG